MEWVTHVYILIMAIGMVAGFIPQDGLIFAAHFRKNWLYLIPYAGVIVWVAVLYVPWGLFWPLPISFNVAVLSVQMFLGIGVVGWVAMVWPRNHYEWQGWWTVTWVMGAVVLSTASLLYSLEQLKIPTPKELPKVERED